MRRLFVRDRDFYKLLVSLAVPIVLKNLITTSIGLADNVMVSSLGDAAVNGATTANLLTNFLFTVLMGISSSVVVLATQYWGKRDTKSMQTIAGIGLRFSLLLGTIGFILSFFFTEFTLRLFTNDDAAVAAGMGYLKIISWTYLLYAVTDVLLASMTSCENVRIGLTVSMTASVMNVILNYCLIFGVRFGSFTLFPVCGVNGAAIATLISRIAEITILSVYVFFTDKKLRLRPVGLLRRSKVLTKDFLKYGLPIMAGGIVWAINVSVQGMLIGKLGVPEAIAASSVAGTLFNLITVVTFGVSAAAGVIIGKTIGSGDVEKVKRYTVTLEMIFLGLGFFTGGMLLLSLMIIPLVYGGLSEGSLAMSRQFVLVLAVTGVGTSYQANSLSLLKAGGDTRFVFLNDTFWVLCVVLPSSALAGYVFGAPPWLVFALMKGDQIYKCFVAIFKVNRFRWIRNLTREASAEG